MSYFNLRVYGLVLNERNEILLSDEHEAGRYFTKFPGGGVEIGEGIIDALKREFMEECATPIAVLSHVYTTDFYEKSSFNESQVVSIYYFVKPLAPFPMRFKNQRFDFDPGSAQAFRWVAVSGLQPEDVTFKTDQVVITLLKENMNESI